MPTRNFPRISNTPMQTLPGRRRLLQLSAALPVTMPVFSVFAVPENKFSYHLVKSQESVAGLIQGAVVLVDSGIKDFRGNGFYLYPDWGQPMVYEVRKRASRLAFYYPGSDKVLWVLSPNPANARFSGRVEGVLSAGESSNTKLLNGELDQLRKLHVPQLPTG